MLCSYCRQVVLWHKPFCVDLQNDTYKVIHQLLETFGLEWREFVPPFPSRAEKQSFVSEILMLLSTHFTLANASNTQGNISPKEKANLERILYR